MQQAIIIAVPILTLAILFVWLARSRSRSTGPGPLPPEKNPFHGLRNQAFSVTREEIGIDSPTRSSSPWGVIMDMGDGKCTVTLVAFAEGSASLYLSTGGGFIGGRGHETIRQAAQALIAAADTFQPQMTLTDQFPEPQTGQTIFYLRTDDGVFTASAPEVELGEQRHPLSPLFHAAQEVITQYRLIEQKH